MAFLESLCHTVLGCLKTCTGQSESQNYIHWKTSRCCRKIFCVFPILIHRTVLGKATQCCLNKKENTLEEEYASFMLARKMTPKVTGQHQQVCQHQREKAPVSIENALTIRSKLFIHVSIYEFQVQITLNLFEL